MRRSEVIELLVDRIKAETNYFVEANPFATADIQEIPMLVPEAGIYVWHYDTPAFKIEVRRSDIGNLKYSPQLDEIQTYVILIGVKSLNPQPNIEDLTDSLKNMFINLVLDDAISPVMVRKVTRLTKDSNEVYWRQILIEVTNYLSISQHN